METIKTLIYSAIVAVLITFLSISIVYTSRMVIDEVNSRGLKSIVNEVWEGTAAEK